MTAPTLTLADFLLARIAEDEAAASAAAPGPWSYGNIESVAGGSLYDPGVMIAGIHWDNPGDRPDPRIHRFRSEEQADRTGDHIARWDPARVLAECEAKRRIVEQCRIALDRMCLPLTPGSGRTGEYAVASLTLGFLALPYADHPDFREEWRP